MCGKNRRLFYTLSMTVLPQKYRQLLPPALLAAVVLAIYFPVFHFGFVRWDDPQLVSENPLVRSFSPKIWVSYDPQLYDPLTMFSYQMEYLIGGGSAGIFHAVNVLLHFLTAYLLYLLLKAFRFGAVAALVGALLWAVHPLHVEAVAWVSGRKELLWAFFFFASLLVSMHFPSGDRRRWLGLPLFLCALLSKVSALTLPVVLLLLEWRDTGRVTARRTAALWPFWLLTVVFGIIALFGRGKSAALLPVMDALLLFVRSIAFTLSKVLWPFSLSAIYPAEPASLLHPASLFGIASVAALFIACYLLRRYRSVVFGLVFFLLTLAPGLFAYLKSNDITLTSDRYAYVPLAGLIIAVLAYHSLLPHSLLRRRLGTISAVVLVVFWATLSHAQVMTWRDTETLFQHVLASAPDSTVAMNNLGFIRLNAGELDAAEKFVTEALALKPDYPDALVNLATIEAKRGRYDEAETALRHALAIQPENAQAWFNFAGIALVRRDDETAVERYRIVVTIRPTHEQAWWQLSNALLRLGKGSEAADAYRTTLTLNAGYRGKNPELDRLAE